MKPRLGSAGALACLLGVAAALLVAAYRTVAVETFRRRLAGSDLTGGDLTGIAAAHRQRLNEAFDAVAHGLPASAPAAPAS